MSNRIVEEKETRKALEEGVRKVKVAVVTTLGPLGQNAAVEQPSGPARVIHDGYSVAKDILLENPLENIGAQLVKQASLQTNDVTGDGTTTSTLLAYEIVHRGNQLIYPVWWKRLLFGQANPMKLKEGIETAVKIVVEGIKLKSQKVKDNDIERVAIISAQNEKIGKIISDAMKKVGKDGVITAQESLKDELIVEYKEGMEYDTPYISPYFSTNPDTLSATLENPYILITDRKIFSMDELTPFMTQMINANKTFVIIAQDVMGEALQLLVTNRLANKFIPLAVRQLDKEVLEDIAIFTGATVISEESGRKLQSVKLADCGRAESVYSDDKVTRIIGGKGDGSAMAVRIALVRAKLETAETTFEKEKLKMRLAKLTGGAAIIYVGALTRPELEEKKERVIDAISSTRAALEEGVVAGGGVTLLWARKALLLAIAMEKDLGRKAGIKIVYDALEVPIRTLIEYAGEKPEKILAFLHEYNRLEHGWGFDVVTKTYESMLGKGIIDAAKVVRSAVENGASAAAMILTTKVAIQHIWKKEEERSV